MIRNTDKQEGTGHIRRHCHKSVKNNLFDYLESDKKLTGI
jgi:hypothetical protein